MASRSAISLDPAQEAEAPTLDGRQTRADARVNVPIGGFFKIFELRGGISKYHHDELETGWRGWVELPHRRAAKCAPTSSRRSAAAGAAPPASNISEPASGSRRREVFARQHQQTARRLHPADRSSAARCGSKPGYGSNPRSSHADADPVIAANGGPIGANAFVRQLHSDFGFDRRQLRFSRPAGARACRCLITSARQRSTNCSRNGPHGGSRRSISATRILPEEASNGVELSVHHTTGPIHVQGSIYYSRFSNFIYQAPTGAMRDGLPVYAYSQGKANYYGFELQSRREIRQGARHRLGRRAHHRRRSRFDQGVRPRAR